MKTLTTTASTVTFSNPCTRCGKQRVDGKTWKEKVTNFFGTSVIIHTETVCPDKECQKIVEKTMEMARQRTEDMRVKKENEKNVRLADKKAASALKA